MLVAASPAPILMPCQRRFLKGNRAIAIPGNRGPVYAPALLRRVLAIFAHPACVIAKLSRSSERNVFRRAWIIGAEPEHALLFAGGVVAESPQLRANWHNQQVQPGAVR